MSRTLYLPNIITETNRRMRLRNSNDLLKGYTYPVPPKPFLRNLCTAELYHLNPEVLVGGHDPVLNC